MLRLVLFNGEPKIHETGAALVVHVVGGRAGVQLPPKSGPVLHRKVVLVALGADRTLPALIVLDLVLADATQARALPTLALPTLITDAFRAPRPED